MIDIQSDLNTMPHYITTALNCHTQLMWQWMRKKTLMSLVSSNVYLQSLNARFVIFNLKLIWIPKDGRLYELTLVKVIYFGLWDVHEKNLYFSLTFWFNVARFIIKIDWVDQWYISHFSVVASLASKDFH
jgi:hypothetical protein